jgi:hypothetical protein
MDFQLLCIVLVFILIFIFDKIDIKEKFAVVRQGYYNPSPFLDLQYDPSPSAINLGNKDRSFGNFGAFGSFPNPLCPSCDLSGDMVTAPYLHANDLGDEYGSLYGKVARRCDNVCGKNYNDLNKPVLVAGRSAGRTRQCRKLI